MSEFAKNLSGQANIQEEFLGWFRQEKIKGLKDIKFFPGDVAQATIDSFIEESRAIDRALANKKHCPIPNTL